VRYYGNATIEHLRKIKINNMRYSTIEGQVRQSMNNPIKMKDWQEIIYNKYYGNNKHFNTLEDFKKFLNNLPDDLFEDLIKNIDIQLEMRTTDKQLRQGEPTIDEMRWDIAEHEAMNMQTKDIIDYLFYGFGGLEDMPDIEVRDEWESLFKNE
jgi:hypothetical protein